MEKRIDINTIKIENSKTILISELEEQLVHTKKDQELAIKAQEFYDNAPEEMRQFIVLIPVLDVQELEDKISYYKNMEIIDGNSI